MRLMGKVIFLEAVSIIALSLHCCSRLGLAFRPIASRTGRTLSLQHPASRLYLSTDNIESASKEDVNRWEAMYQGGGSGEDYVAYSTRSEIRVVTFDLDNTLWNTSGCIDAANDALATFLQADKIAQPKRVEVVMGDLFQANKFKYCPIDTETAKSPVLLTQLRTDAVQQVLEQYNGYSPEDALAYAEQAFDVWTKARHDAIPHNFATSVLACLDKVSSIQTSMGHPVLIGAITDGNSDPRNVEVLREYFDFCINAESIGVGKPDRRVYLEAARTVASHPSFQDLGVKDVENEEELENAVGPYWVHIGDDFVKDIVAAKSLKMRSVWATELIQDKLVAKQMRTPSSAVTKNNNNDSNTSSSEKPREVEEFVKEIAGKGVVEMSIGADSYLADSMTREFVDAVVEEFHHLSDLLLGWHEEGTSLLKAVPDAKGNDTSSQDTPKQQETTLQDKEQPTTRTVEAELVEAFEELEKLRRNKNAVGNQDSDDFISYVVPDKVKGKPVEASEAANGDSGKSPAGNIWTPRARAFRIIREDCTMDVLAPARDRDTSTMYQVMSKAQMDKSSGVFAFLPAQAQAFQEGKMVLMIMVGGTDLQFSKQIFNGMSVEDVLSLTDQDPVTLSLYMVKAADSPSFDVF